ncbi:MAG TPA: insulinase family protein [Candidatus Limnocylindrales bacterium]|nr:insulinase family protein [Candidatus Limnocylindrales bacterium]
MTAGQRRDLPEVSRTEVDGIPAYWSEVPGDFTAGLIFRVGVADEELLTRGITHAVEHLAAGVLGETPYPSNAFVSGMRTVFHAAGPREEVTAHLRAVAAALTALPSERYDVELDVLRSEAEGFDPGTGVRAFMLRYGFQSHGLNAAPELGLHWLGPAEVQAWAHERFTRGAAALFFSGRPPTDLSLDLPDGVLRPVPPAEHAPEVTYPAQVADDPGGLALDLTGPRESGFSAGLLTAERRLRQRLRHQEGWIYDLSSDYLPLDAEIAGGGLAMECGADRLERVRDAVLEVMGDLSANGPTAAELAHHLDQYERQFGDPDAGIGFLDLAATDHLLGKPDRTPASLRESHRELTPTGVAATLRELMERALLMGPPELPLARGFHAYPAWSVERAQGRSFRPVSGPLFGLLARERLIVGDDAATIDLGDGRLVTVSYATCAAALHDGDHGRVLWGPDGVQLAIHADHWRDGARAIAALDALVPADVVICDDHGRGRPARR